MRKLLEPNTKKWIDAMGRFNRGQADLIAKLAAEHSDPYFCAICGEDTKNTFKAQHLPLLIRLCDTCKEAQETLYNYKLERAESP
jgi:hypothetical protein